MGLAPEYYGNVNIPRYPGSASQLGDDTSKKLIKWREEERDNNILVFGNDLTANEQNQYEGAILGMITQVDFFMIDGGKIEMKPWGMEGYTPGDYMKLAIYTICSNRNIRYTPKIGKNKK